MHFVAENVSQKLCVKVHKVSLFLFYVRIFFFFDIFYIIQRETSFVRIYDLRWWLVSNIASH